MKAPFYVLRVDSSEPALLTLISSFGSKKGAEAYFQTLPAIERPPEQQNENRIEYWEGSDGQHAVVLQAPHDGENWRHALIYDRNNRRIKVLKYSLGSYQC